MRSSILLALGLIITAIPTARAVTLQDCSQGTTEKRIACLQADIVLLNSSHEAVATELRNAITDLTTKVGTLTTNVGTLTTQVKTLTTQVNDLKGQIPNLDSVAIEWAPHPTSCITYMGNNLVQIVDTCKDPNKNKFMIRPFQQ
jgi:hypothetical protein